MVPLKRLLVEQEMMMFARTAYEVLWQLVALQLWTVEALLVEQPEHCLLPQWRLVVLVVVVGGAFPPEP